MAKKALAALGIAMIATAAAVTISLGTGQQAHANNTLGGAGNTVTESAAPSTIDTPSAAPTVKAQPFAGGEGNGHG